MLQAYLDSQELVCQDNSLEQDQQVAPINLKVISSLINLAEEAKVLLPKANKVSSNKSFLSNRLLTSSNNKNMDMVISNMRKRMMLQITWTQVWL